MGDFISMTFSVYCFFFVQHGLDYKSVTLMAIYARAALFTM